MRRLHLNGGVFNFLALSRSLTDDDGEKNEISFAEAVPSVVLYENFKSVKNRDQFALKRALQGVFWDGKAVISFDFSMCWTATVS